VFLRIVIVIVLISFFKCNIFAFITQQEMKELRKEHFCLMEQFGNSIDNKDKETAVALIAKLVNFYSKYVPLNAPRNYLEICENKLSAELYIGLEDYDISLKKLYNIIITYNVNMSEWHKFLYTLRENYIDQEPDWACIPLTAYVRIGDIYEKLERYDKAKEYYIKCLKEIKPYEENPAYESLLGDLRVRLIKYNVDVPKMDYGYDTYQFRAKSTKPINAKDSTN